GDVRGGAVYHSTRATNGRSECCARPGCLNGRAHDGADNRAYCGSHHSAAGRTSDRVASRVVAGLAARPVLTGHTIQGLLIWVLTHRGVHERPRSVESSATTEQQKHDESTRRHRVTLHLHSFSVAPIGRSFASLAQFTCRNSCGRNIALYLSVMSRLGARPSSRATSVAALQALGTGKRLQVFDFVITNFGQRRDSFYEIQCSPHASLSHT